MDVPTKNDHDLGCEMGVASYKETPISGTQMTLVLKLNGITWDHSPGGDGNFPQTQRLNVWYIYLPATHMGPLVLIGRLALFWGVDLSKIEVIWVPGEQKYLGKL